MISQQAIEYLRLSLVSGVGVVTARQLMDSFGSIPALWQHISSPSSSAQTEITPRLFKALSAAHSTAMQQQIDAIIAQCESAGVGMICPDDETWPAPLHSCADAPLVLYVYGQLACLQSDKILAMVGARKASAEGKLITRRWSSYMSKQGVVVVSGMAPGIDSAAHGGSLDADASGIAVLGYGHQAGNLQQQKQIQALAEQGCVISEYPPNREAHASFFPQRNRLIAGLSQALIVVEGGLKSGSLITARQALNYGRDIFAVPGSVLNDIHAGCHQLIQDGAMLAADAEYILTILGWKQEEKAADTYQAQSDVEAQILQLLGREIKHVDALAEDCGLTVPELSTILLALELGGIITKLPGSRYTLS